MTVGLYTIKDELSNYTPPIAINNEQQARRYFQTQLTTNTLMSNAKKDFSLWKVGEYDSEKGEIINEKLCHELIERGESYAE